MPDMDMQINQDRGDNVAAGVQHLRRVRCRDMRLDSCDTLAVDGNVLPSM